MEGPTRTMRGVPSPVTVTFFRRQAHSAPRRWPVLLLASAAPGELRRGPQAAGHRGGGRGSRHTRGASAQKGASEAAAPRRRFPG